MPSLLKYSSTAPPPASTPDSTSDAAALSVPGSASIIIGRHGAKLQQLFPELLPDHTYMAFTRGAWSLHQMVKHVAGLIGPCDVWITSWGIAQEPLNAILQMHRDGQIRQLRCLFDSRIREECPQAYQLTLLSNAVIKLGKNHSKVVVLMNEHASVVIPASANLTNNPRMETYVLMTHRHMATGAAHIIDQVLLDAQPFEAL